MTDTLQVPKPVEHGYLIIAVAGERIKTEMVSDLKFLQSGETKYKIIDRIEMLRGEFMPTTLMLLSSGKFITSKEYFSFYKKSKNINFFICQKIDSNTI